MQDDASEEILENEEDKVAGDADEEDGEENPGVDELVTKEREDAWPENRRDADEENHEDLAQDVDDGAKSETLPYLAILETVTEGDAGIAGKEEDDKLDEKECGEGDDEDGGADAHDFCSASDGWEEALGDARVDVDDEERGSANCSASDDGENGRNGFASEELAASDGESVSEIRFVGVEILTESEPSADECVEKRATDDGNNDSLSEIIYDDVAKIAGG